MLRRTCMAGLILFIFAGLFYPDVQAGQDTITVGRVSDNPKKHYKRLKPFIDYIAERLKHTGIKEGKILLAKDNHQLIEYLREDKIDIVTETLFSTIIFIEKAGVKPLVRRWKKGAPVYSSCIFVRKDSGINSLKDLKGKVIAFEDPGSTTSYFLPRVSIIEEGFEAVELENYNQKPPPDKVGYCFARGEPNIAHWVHEGLVDAGALSNLELRESGGEVPAGFLPNFKVIHKADSIPRNIMSVRKNMDPWLAEEIKDVLLNMAETEEGRRIMRNLAKTTKFDEFPEGVEEIITTFRQKYSLIKEEIEREYPE